jgi:hypothetical protein
VLVQFYVNFGVAMHKTLPAVKYLLEQIGLTVLENCEESKQLTTRTLIEIAERDRVDLAFELILRMADFLITHCPSTPKNRSKNQAECTHT